MHRAINAFKKFNDLLAFIRIQEYINIGNQSINKMI